MPSAPRHKCPNCDKTFGRKGDKSRHNKTAHNPNVITVHCPYPCSIRLDFSASPTSPTISWTKPNPEWLPCTASATVVHKTNLKTHKLKHVGYRWPCPKCGKTYLDRASSSRHKHTWEPSFKENQEEIQNTLLEQGDDWLRDVATPIIAMRLWNALGSAVSGSGGALSDPDSQDTVTPPGGIAAPDSASTPRTSAMLPKYHPYPPRSAHPHRRSRSTPQTPSRPEPPRDVALDLFGDGQFSPAQYNNLPHTASRAPATSRDPAYVLHEENRDYDEFEGLIDPQLLQM